MVLERLRLQSQALAHGSEQALDGLNAGRDLAALDTADRRLVGSGPQRQAALADAMPLAGVLYQQCRFQTLEIMSYKASGRSGEFARAAAEAGAEQRLLVAGSDHRLAVEFLDPELGQAAGGHGVCEGLHRSC